MTPSSRRAALALLLGCYVALAQAQANAQVGRPSCLDPGAAEAGEEEMEHERSPLLPC